MYTTHHTIGKCILCGENTPHWTTVYCFVQGGWQCTLTTNLQSTILYIQLLPGDLFTEVGTYMATLCIIVMGVEQNLSEVKIGCDRT